MNCKPNELARVVGDTLEIGGNNHRIVHVDEACKCALGAWRCTLQQTFDSPFGKLPAGCQKCIRDQYLRPLPGDDNQGEDEMLRIGGKPMEKPLEVIEGLTA